MSGVSWGEASLERLELAQGLLSEELLAARRQGKTGCNIPELWPSLTMRVAVPSQPHPQAGRRPPVHCCLLAYQVLFWFLNVDESTFPTFQLTFLLE